MAAAAGAFTILIYTVNPSGAEISTAIVGCTITVLIFIRRWLAHLEEHLTDTTEERRGLAERTAQSQASHMANIAARNRLRVAAAEEEARNEERLTEAIADMRDEFENTRAQELCKAYEIGALNERNGIHKEGVNIPAGSLIYLADRRPTGAPLANPARQPNP
ncbi:hypothetical protein OG455_41910 [Kitasatospora sp. NBC_01287]|uniref:hypothetical protein n=1 Tax=Kitasatospora sp. NBC_01287 TaxID=2903573 RepID=UPI00225ABE1D|nr:hypothetical protein [Kitasatospora sp. NBC_01287]MCX4751707.1 hypothetical protein [Kitasatospora sp. NBC_01287]MCX4752001.1 hypothetical protein [Kitasatospora sp. NBC_01287]